MDTTIIRCLINSISRFIHLVSCQTSILTPIQKDCRSMVLVLKHLKSVLDEVADYKISSNEILCQEFQELDKIVNEARELTENWSPKMSKIYSVRQTDALLTKIQSSTLEICHVLCELLQTSTLTSSLTVVQHCIDELQCFRKEKVTEHIEAALRCRRDDMVPSTEQLMKIIESLSLTSKQELLKESVAVEKDRLNLLLNKKRGSLGQIEEIVDLISVIRNCLLKAERREPNSGVPIPSYFRCPLSLELMLDPVIVASGQTYERASIQNWIEHGLNVCPTTRQTLAHTNLIPNYTVKAMIANWCEENNVVLKNSAPSQSDRSLSHADSFRSLHGSNSVSRSYPEVGNGFEKRKGDLSTKSFGEGSNRYQIRENENIEIQSHELSYIHSRSESTSSAMSSIEYVHPEKNEAARMAPKHENLNNLSGEITSECCAASSNKESGYSPCLSEKQFQNLKTKSDVGNGDRSCSRTQSLPSCDSGSDDLTTVSHVKKLIEDLKSQSNKLQTAAAAELRFLAKHNMENRIVIGQSDAIRPLLSLLYSEVKLTQEHTVTALLNLSINEENKVRIAEAGAIEPLIHVLKSGNDGAKENSAATLFSISVLEEYKAKIGRSGAVKALVDLLASGTLRGKKDAATALFNLSIFHENKARIVKAGAVKHLVKLMDPSAEMVDKAVALLANLSTIEEGRKEIVRAGGIPLLVEVVETGSSRGKENAASVLTQLCLNSPKFCTLVLQEGAVPPLVALSQSGTPRAKEKAQQLLSHFRSQREASLAKSK